ncbi:MAG: DUF4184 family protein [Candidatus Thorarchaeota archaeon]
MPSSVISHQAPVLVLKIKYPKKFDGTALCISTFVPDFIVFFEPLFQFPIRGFSHSFFGLIYFSLPLTLLLSVLFRKYLFPYLSQIARKEGVFSTPLNYLGIEAWEKLRNKKYDLKAMMVAIYSAIIGGVTHLLLDLPSHEYNELFFPWLIIQNPDFLLFSVGQWQNYTLKIYDIIWIIESFVGLIITIYCLRYIKKKNLIEKWYNEP